jgi:predicted dehydrogenase
MKNNDAGLNRRDFILRAGGAAAATWALQALPALAQQTNAAAGAEADRPKVKLGLVGCGGRGAWIAGLFAQHGGYSFHAVADYFPEVAADCGQKLGVPRERCFSGLSGYKRVLESGVEAVALETPPYFFPKYASAAVEAGLHVYMAKPVAVDVPGCMAILRTGQSATAKRRVFLVDYQMPTDPVNIDIRQRILDGGLGDLSYVNTYGIGHGFPDPPKEKTIESRLRGLVWVNDVALGGDNIGNFDIHALDAALWVLGRKPAAASGLSRICRPAPHGDARDVCQVVYEYADGLTHMHLGQALPNMLDDALTVRLVGEKVYADVVYWGRSMLRGGAKSRAGDVENLYDEGAKRNIAAFHDCVTKERFENETVQRAVDGCLIAILGREAAARKTRLTMDELIQENRKLEVDLQGLKD